MQIVFSWIQHTYWHCSIKTVENTLLHRAIDLYQKRDDKEWGLTDCISFIVMDDQGLGNALTSDEHFQQAGFRALLREDITLMK